MIDGSDGEVKVRRMFRIAKRVIGDDANLIRRMPPMKGRIFSVAVSHDGMRIAVASSLDGSGQVAVYEYEFDTSMPDEIKKINELVVTRRNAEQMKKLDEYHRRDGAPELTVLASIPDPASSSKVELKNFPVHLMKSISG